MARVIVAGAAFAVSAFLVSSLCLMPGRADAAARQWIEVRSGQFIVAIDSTERIARDMLGELRTQLNRAADALVPLERAVALEMDSVRNRVSFARALALVDRRDDAQRVAQAALTMATTEADRRAAQQLIDLLQKIGNAPIRR
jgi:hypothetical protein